MAVPDPTQTLNRLGERGAIARLASRLGAPPSGVLGIGDDCAVVPGAGPGWDLALTSDPLMETRHFLPDTDPLRIGHKAAGRVLSDLAAMGAEPLWLLVNLVAAPGSDMGRLEALYDGMRALCERHGAAIVGGDMAAGDRLELHVFAVGRVPHGAAVTRSGARPGDVLFVTGPLGGSLLGRHLDFEPRVREGLWLREGGWPHAMIDVSDGPAADLRRLFEESGVGACLEAASLPVSDAARRMGGDPFDHALCDGEDYELLVCVEPGRADALESAWPFPEPCRRIGEITSDRGRLDVAGPSGRRPYGGSGYEHFLDRAPGSSR